MGQIKKIKIFTEIYFPEETSTGYFVTKIAEALSAKLNIDTSVYTCQSGYHKRREKLARRESVNGVDIYRHWSSRFDKNNLLGRFANQSISTLMYCWAALLNIKKGDTVLVLTNPPVLPLIVIWIGRLMRAKVVVLVHDVYPDILHSVGMLNERNIIYRLFARIQAISLARATSVIVLGRDAKELIEKKHHKLQNKVHIITNWTDLGMIDCLSRTENLLRKSLNLEDKFVVQFSGNLGRTHGVEDLMQVVKKFRQTKEIHFFVYGWGAGRLYIEKFIEQNSLNNITLRDPCLQSELSMYLNCCDVFLMLFRKGMAGLSVPSRMYNVLAAGNPIIAVGEAHSELALVVKENQIGWVVEPGNIAGIEQSITEAYRTREELEQMRLRARKAAEEKYEMSVVLEQYQHELNRVITAESV